MGIFMLAKSGTLTIDVDPDMFIIEGGETGGDTSLKEIGATTQSFDSAMELHPEDVSELLGDGGNVVVLKSIVMQSLVSIKALGKSGNKEEEALVVGISLIRLS